MKNKHFDKRNASSPLLWAIFHATIFLSLAILFLCGKKFSINTNLFDILPESSESSMKSVGNADRVLSAKTGRQFVILVQADDFSVAKRGAEFLYHELMLYAENSNSDELQSGIKTTSSKKDALFESISLAIDSNDLNELLEFYYRNRFLLLDKETIAKLNSGGEDELAQDALEKAYSGFSIMPMEYISSDPFFLTEVTLENLVNSISKSQTAMSLHDGVLAAEFEGKFYVMLRGTLTTLGASITNKKSGVKKIYECAQKVQSQICDKNSQGELVSESQSQLAKANFSEFGSESVSKTQVEFIFSGVPFHSYKSSSSAQKEIAIISTLSIIAIIVLFVFIFKTALPILCSVAAIGLSALTALCATLLVFGEIHILCFVFGTTLIGTCLDYSIHFFIRWKDDVNLKDGFAIRKKLFKGLLLSFASTEICYLILLFAPFALLRQIAIFSSFGILSSFLTVILLYPIIAIPVKTDIGLSAANNVITNLFQNIYRKFAIKDARASHTQTASNVRHDICDNAKVVIAIFIATMLIAITIYNRKNLRIENDLRSFYTMSGKLLDDEILAAKVLNHGSSGSYLIVRGQSQEELLQNEETFCKILDKEIAHGNLNSYTATTQFVPSILSQRESFNACKNLLDENLLQSQFLDLGFSNEEIPELLSQIHSDYENCKNQFIQIETQNTADNLRLQNPIPAYEKNAISSLWIGQVDGEWFSAILPLHAIGKEELLSQLCENEKNVFLVNKMQDVGKELNRLTKIMLVLLAAAFAILMVCLKFFYPVKTLLRIAIVPIAIILCECAAVALFNIPLGFFSVTGIILVFGLGLDYIIYTVESGEKLNRFAIFLSFLTTELSFGAIALSSFVPVHIFGTVVFVGLLAAYLQLTIKGSSKKSTFRETCEF